MKSIYFIHAGRSLLALYFIVPGLFKFLDWDGHIALMTAHGMIMAPLFLALAGILQLSAGACLMINRYVMWSALALALLTLAINFNLHDFWNYSGIEGDHELQNFIKNLGIFAGLLVLTGLSASSTNQSSTTA